MISDDEKDQEGRGAKAIVVVNCMMNKRASSNVVHLLIVIIMWINFVCTTFDVQAWKTQNNTSVLTSDSKFKHHVQYTECFVTGLLYLLGEKF
jgi:hypothetical protein